MIAQHSPLRCAIFLNKGSEQHFTHTNTKCAIIEVVLNNIDHITGKAQRLQIQQYTISLFSVIYVLHVKEHREAWLFMDEGIFHVHFKSDQTICSESSGLKTRLIFL